MLVRTPYNYKRYRRVAAFCCYDGAGVVLESDTSVTDAMKNSSNVNAQKDIPMTFTNCDVPVSPFGAGLLETPWNPFIQRMPDLNSGASMAEGSSAAVQSQNVAAAAAANSQTTLSE